ncbi:MAG: ABC transporter permease [Spirochaetaceae bacterium]|nr:ABC transporter permease [Spirochaetaceae bacterium]
MNDQSGTILLAILKAAFPASVPLLFAALGGLFSELSGMLNIALEGLMGAGAFFGMAAALVTGSRLAGLAGALAAAGLAAWIMGTVTLRVRANIFITGLALNLAVSGLTTFLSQLWFGTKAVVNVPLPPLSKQAFTAVILAAAAAWICCSALVLHGTTFGIRLRATGMNPTAMTALGHDPDRYRLAALLISGMASAAGGYILALSVSAYVPNIVSGRGWIALVAIYLGKRRPLAVAASCLLFALAESASNYLQGVGGMSPLIMLALPYLVTLISLVVGTGARQRH